MNIETAEIMNDIQNIIRRFDDCLDDMFDRGAFDCGNKEDKELDDYLTKMKEKYLGK